MCLRERDTLWAVRGFAEDYQISPSAVRLNEISPFLSVSVELLHFYYDCGKTLVKILKPRLHERNKQTLKDADGSCLTSGCSPKHELWKTRVKSCDKRLVSGVSTTNLVRCWGYLHCVRGRLLGRAECQKMNCLSTSQRERSREAGRHINRTNTNTQAKTINTLGHLNLPCDSSCQQKQLHKYQGRWYWKEKQRGFQRLIIFITH